MVKKEKKKATASTKSGNVTIIGKRVKAMTARLRTFSSSSVSSDENDGQTKDDKGTVVEFVIYEMSDGAGTGLGTSSGRLRTQGQIHR